MLPFLIACALLLLAALGIYLLLKSMGENGVEAAAPGSCKSGRCGVRPPVADEDPAPSRIQGQVVRIEDYRRNEPPEH